MTFHFQRVQALYNFVTCTALLSGFKKAVLPIQAFSSSSETAAGGAGSAPLWSAASIFLAASRASVAGFLAAVGSAALLVLTGSSSFVCTSCRHYGISDLWTDTLLIATHCLPLSTWKFRRQDHAAEQGRWQLGLLLRPWNGAEDWGCNERAHLHIRSTICASHKGRLALLPDQRQYAGAAHAVTVSSGVALQQKKQKKIDMSKLCMTHHTYRT